MPGPDLRRKFLLTQWLARKRLQHAIDTTVAVHDAEMATLQAEEDRNPPLPLPLGQIPDWAKVVAERHKILT